MICLVEDPYQKHSVFMGILSGFLLPQSSMRMKSGNKDLSPDSFLKR